MTEDESRGIRQERARQVALYADLNDAADGPMSRRAIRSTAAWRLWPRPMNGRSAMLLFTGRGAPKVGSFHDRFVRIETGWRFAERRGSLTF